MKMTIFEQFVLLYGFAYNLYHEVSGRRWHCRLIFLSPLWVLNLNLPVLLLCVINIFDMVKIQNYNVWKCYFVG